jgi:hypothetical protein
MITKLREYVGYRHGMCWRSASWEGQRNGAAVGRLVHTMLTIYGRTTPT